MLHSASQRSAHHFNIHSHSHIHIHRIHLLACSFTYSLSFLFLSLFRLIIVQSARAFFLCRRPKPCDLLRNTWPNWTASLIGISHFVFILFPSLSPVASSLFLPFLIFSINRIHLIGILLTHLERPLLPFEGQKSFVSTSTPSS